MAVLGSLVLGTPAFAQTPSAISAKADLREKGEGVMGLRGMIKLQPNVIGTVTAINGNTITVSSNKMGWGKDNKEEKKPGATPTPVIYTINATTASAIKANVASTVSAIAVGDMVTVQGTVTGTNVVATTIRDNGIKPTRTPEPKSSPLIQGNGQPIIAGAITAINGNTITITNKSNVTYTVDAANAKIQNKNTLSTVSSLVIGDNVIVQGTINGTSIAAYSVIDHGTNDMEKEHDRNPRGKMFGGIGRFFQHLFGF